MRQQHADGRRQRKYRGLSLTVTGMLAVIGLAVTGTAQAATQVSAGPATITQPTLHGSRMIPDSAENCTYGSSGGNTQTCVYVQGSGLHVDYVRAWASVINSARTLLVLISTPNYATSSPWTLVHKGQTLSKQWSPNATEPAGNYCATTDRMNNNGTWTQIGHICVKVTS